MKLAASAATIGIAMLAGVQCSGPAKAAGQGASCFRAEECAEGLVCIDEKCTGDLSSVNFVPEGGRGPIEAGVVETD